MPIHPNQRYIFGCHTFVILVETGTYLCANWCEVSIETRRAVKFYRDIRRCSMEVPRGGENKICVNQCAGAPPGPHRVSWEGWTRKCEAASLTKRPGKERGEESWLHSSASLVTTCAQDAGGFIIPQSGPAALKPAVAFPPFIKVNFWPLTLNIHFLWIVLFHRTYHLICHAASQRGMMRVACKWEWNNRQC